jgi:transposase
MDTNVVERAIRPHTLTRKNAKLNGVDPMAWLTDVLERIVSGRTKAHELATLLPWNWKPDNAPLLNTEPPILAA